MIAEYLPLWLVGSHGQFLIGVEVVAWVAVENSQWDGTLTPHPFNKGWTAQRYPPRCYLLCNIFRLKDWSRFKNQKLRIEDELATRNRIKGALDCKKWQAYLAVATRTLSLKRRQIWLAWAHRTTQTWVLSSEVRVSMDSDIAVHALPWIQSFVGRLGLHSKIQWKSKFFNYPTSFCRQ